MSEQRVEPVLLHTHAGNLHPSYRHCRIPGAADGSDLASARRGGCSPVTFRMTTISRSRRPVDSSEHSAVRKRPEVIVRSLGKRIRQLRTEKGWSQERLAEEAGMHRTYMWGIEQGMRNPSVRHLARLADALGIPVRALFDEQ